MTLKRIALFALLLSIGACTNRAERELTGKWQAFEILEEEAPLPLDPAQVRFEFLAGKGYTFHGTLNYKEAGVFRIHRGYLYTTDTLNHSKEKAVRIEQMRADTLLLEMNDQGKTRLLKLRRATW